MSLSIVPSVKRYVALLTGWGAMVLVAGLVSGCGGVSGSHSVSPGSFFIPGVIQNDTAPRQAPERATELPGETPPEWAGEKTGSLPG